AAQADAIEQGAVGNAGGGDEHVAGSEFGDVVDPIGVGDAHGHGVVALGGRIEDQLALHPAADAAQGGGGQHAFGGAAGAEIDVDAGILGVDRMDDAGNVAVADELDGDAGGAQFLDEGGVAGAVEHDGGDFAQRHALGPGQGLDV